MTRGIYAVKPRFQACLRRAEARLDRMGVGADVLTFAGVAASVAIALALIASSRWALLLLFVAPLALLRLSCNALDGMIAGTTGTARPWGGVLNELCDRLSDIVILGAVAIRAGTPLLGCAAIITSLLSSHAGVLSLSVRASRQYGGPMGKADRMIALAVAASFQAGAAPWPVLTAYLVIVVLGAMVTAVSRVRATHHELSAHRLGA